ncbi:hypothetical protein [Stenotrophomonas sp.]|uniref:hypothetical protein n=1 Tax=Stenotrophomonas sp. TaxID=69392 RepID=UPI002FC74C56
MKSPPAPRWSRPCAVAVVIAVHGLLLQVLLAPAPVADSDTERQRLVVRWLPRAEPAAAPLSAAVPARLPAARPAVPRPPPPAALRLTDDAPPPVPGPPAAALDLRVPGAGPGQDGVDGATFVAPVIGRREVHAAFAPAPRRFRMKRGLTPAQLVQGVAQALQLWPPGYVVDPCRLNTAQVDYFQNAVDERDRDLLRAALVSQRQAC